MVESITILKIRIKKLLILKVFTTFKDSAIELKNQWRIFTYFIWFNKKNKNIKIDQNSPLVIICRYNENLDWVNKIEIPFLIINKGKRNLNFSKEAIINLPNIGRESHSILHFLIHYYDTLPLKSIFIQGDPFEHYPEIIDQLNDNINSFIPIQPLSIHYAQPFSEILKNRIEYKTGIPNFEILEKHTQRINNVPFYVEKLNSNGIQKHYVWNFGLNYLELLCERLGLPSKNEAFFNYAGQFSVDKKLIEQQSKIFYKNCMQFLLEDNINGHLFERLWLTIFHFHEYFKLDITND